jgi:hypothetical protein
MFFAPGLVFRGTEGVGSHFHVGPDSFSTVPRALVSIFIFCTSGLVFGDNEGIGTRFHVLCAWNSFRRYRGSHVPFSCFKPSDSVSAVLRASAPVFMFWALGHDFDGTEGVMPRFHVLRARTRFRRYRGRRVSFSCFARPDSVSAVSTASALIFMLCVPRLGFDGFEGVLSRFHVLRARNHFWQCRGSRAPFSCFARSDSVSAVPRTSAPVFMFCAPGLVFGGTEGVVSRFHVLRARTLF